MLTIDKKTSLTYKGQLFLHMPQTLPDNAKKTYKRYVEQVIYYSLSGNLDRLSSSVNKATISKMTSLVLRVIVPTYASNHARWSYLREAY